MIELFEEIEMRPARKYCTKCPNCSDFRHKTHVKSLMVFNDPDNITRFKCMHPGCPWNTGQWMPTPAGTRATQRDEPDEIIEPVGSDVNLPTCDDRSHRIWWYRDSLGRAWFGNMRIDYGGSKIYCPVVYRNGSIQRLKHWPKKRIFYNEPALVKDKLLVCEGEKDTDAAQEIFPNTGCISWRGGAKNWNTADWHVITGKIVYLWPDNDQDGAGSDVMRMLASILKKQNTVYMVDTSIFPVKKSGLADNLPMYKVGLALKGAVKL